jgi:protein-tyrosine phosphatase
VRTELFSPDRGAAPGRLSTMARPRGGEWLAEEMEALARDGVDRLVCLLTDSELIELDLVNEPTLAREAGLEFVRLPVSDLEVPGAGPTAALAKDLAQSLLGDRHVVIHCRAGIGRSSVLAAAVLVVEGLTPEDAWARVAEARGLPVPDTEAQRAFVDALHADGWLGD